MIKKRNEKRERMTHPRLDIKNTAARTGSEKFRLRTRVCSPRGDQFDATDDSANENDRVIRLQQLSYCTDVSGENSCQLSMPCDERCIASESLR